MKVIVSGGGTGGHIYPALAIANGLMSSCENVEILYVGSPGSMEEDLAVRAGFRFAGVSVAPLPRSISAAAVKSIRTNLQGLRESKKIIKEFAPDVVIGTGGYVCGVVLLAAHKSGVSTVMHEQNAVMGLTNRLLSRIVDVACLTFEEAKKSMKKPEKAVLTGLPVRKEILHTDKAEAFAALGLDAAKRTVLITGGSQGAQKLNDATYPLWKKLLDADIQVIHLVGKHSFAQALEQVRMQDLTEEKGLVVCEFLHEMHYALAAADLVVARAGASFMAEIMVLGTPAILVPYPFAAGDHQTLNARSLQQAGGAVIIKDADISAEVLSRELFGLLDDADKLKEMSAACLKQGNKDAVKDIVAQIVKVAKK